MLVRDNFLVEMTRRTRSALKLTSGRFADLVPHVRLVQIGEARLHLDDAVQWGQVQLS